MRVEIALRDLILSDYAKRNGQSPSNRRRDPFLICWPRSCQHCFPDEFRDSRHHSRNGDFCSVDSTSTDGSSLAPLLQLLSRLTYDASFRLRLKSLPRLRIKSLPCKLERPTSPETRFKSSRRRSTSSKSSRARPTGGSEQSHRPTFRFDSNTSMLPTTTSRTTCRHSSSPRTS